MNLRLHFFFLAISGSLCAQEVKNGTWITCGQRASLHHTRSSLTTTSDTIAQGMFQAHLLNAPESAGIAVKEALSLWGRAIQTSVPVRIKMEWTRVSGNFLATTQPTIYVKNYSPLASPAVWYPVALAEKIARKEINAPDAYEIAIRINESINWHTNPNSEPEEDAYDLLTVLLHEIAHGLGFISSAAEDTSGVSLSSDSYFSIYDHLLATNEQERLYHLHASPVLMEQAITGNDVFIYTASQETYAWYPVHSPEVFLPGVSLSHLSDESTTSGALMTPYIRSGWKNHAIDNITLRILNSLGWDPEYPQELVLYPNPAKDVLHVQVPPYIDRLQVDFYTLRGYHLGSKFLQNNTGSTFSVAIPPVQQLYIIRLRSADLGMDETARIAVEP